MAAETFAVKPSRSGVVASTVAVPNSLGPAELLLHYGTQEQRDYYLPRLARGEEIPCFALTGPLAGSDAGALATTEADKTRHAGSRRRRSTSRAILDRGRRQEV